MHIGRKIASVATAMMLFLSPLPRVARADNAPRTADDRIQIVIECQHSHIREDFEANMEEQFPDVDIVVQYNYSQNVLYSVSQSLTHGLAPDIYVCEFLPNLGDELLSTYFYDMATEGFVSNYYLSAIEGSATIGKGLYYLPGPSYVYGILYDKTAFDALGLSVPHSYSEFAELCRTVNNMGLVGYEPDPSDSSKLVEVPVQAFVPTIMWPDMFQIVFNTLNYESTFRGIKNAKWLNDYQKGEDSLVNHLQEAAQKYMKMFDDGILSLDFWQTKPFYRTKKLYEYHTSLMTIECQQGFEYNKTFGAKRPDNVHEIGMMPIYTSDAPNSGYLYGIPRSYFGITKQGAQDPEKLQAMLRIMDYLSTVDGQKKLISGPDYFGFLKNDATVSSSLYAEVQDVINDERVVNSFFLGGRNSRGKVENYLHGQTPALINGEITIDQWLQGADAARDTLLHPEAQTVYGQVVETLMPMQSAYVVGQTYLHAMDADIGYVQLTHNYGTLQPMFSGEITDMMIQFNSPEMTSVAQPIEGDMDYVVVEMTGEELMACIQQNDQHARAALAGVEMVFDSTQPGLAQYVSLSIGGKPMDMQRTYRVAALRGSVAAYTPVAEYKGLTFHDMFLRYLDEVAQGVITSPTQVTLIQ